MTLIELLCVCAILAILMSLLLPAVIRAYQRAVAFAEEVEAPEISDAIRRGARNYCWGNRKFQFASKTDFADKCRLHVKPRAWVLASRTEFSPFTYLDSTNKVVLVLHYGRNRVNFTMGGLSAPPD